MPDPHLRVPRLAARFRVITQILRNFSRHRGRGLRVSSPRSIERTPPENPETVCLRASSQEICHVGISAERIAPFVSPQMPALRRRDVSRPDAQSRGEDGKCIPLPGMRRELSGGAEAFIIRARSFSALFSPYHSRNHEKGTVNATRETGARA
jgi:hypothetical protein